MPVQMDYTVVYSDYTAGCWGRMVEHSDRTVAHLDRKAVEHLDRMGRLDQLVESKKVAGH